MIDSAVSLLKGIARAAPAALPTIVKLLEGIKKSNDPVEASRRALLALTASTTAKMGADELLKAKAALKRNIKK